MEEQCKALRLADQHLGIRARPKQLLRHNRFIKTHFMGKLFIFREVADELANE